MTRCFTPACKRPYNFTYTNHSLKAPCHTASRHTLRAFIASKSSMGGTFSARPPT